MLPPDNSGSRSGGEVIVVGAGPAGLSVAARLGKAGIEALVLERTGVVGASWRGRYDSLRLNTFRPLSDQPGLRMPRHYGRWVGRDAYVAHLERYAEHHRLRIAFDTTVERLERDEDGWRALTTNGTLTARQVVVATGYDRVPCVPDWPGRETFTGRIIHARDYRSAAPFEGQRVVVVGAGNSGGDIATELAGAAAPPVRMSIRMPPNISPRELLGVPLHAVAVASRRLPAWMTDRMGWAIQRLAFGDLSSYGLPLSPLGIQTAVLEHGRSPLFDDGFVEAVKSGRIEVVAAVERLDRDAVTLADGRSVATDVVVAATGYRRGLEPLVGHLGVLEPDGSPSAPPGSEHPEAPRLHFVGCHVSPLTGTLREIRIEGRRVARAVARRAAGSLAAVG